MNKLYVVVFDSAKVLSSNRIEKHLFVFVSIVAIVLPNRQINDYRYLRL